jgi:hypothetical protein
MNRETEELSSRVAALERQLGESRDILAIYHALACYSRGLDWLDASLLDRAVFDDAEMDFGTYRGTGKDFKVQMLTFQRTVAPRRWHMTSCPQILLKGDSALVDSYILSCGANSVEPQAGSKLSAFYALYFDTFARRNGEWKILKRKYTLVSNAESPEPPPGKVLDRETPINRIGIAEISHPDYRSLL